MQQLPKRLLSIDVLRAITMFLMIFVNDSAGMTNVPLWLEHAEASADAMGFADTIFPAFLLIVGLSLPFAINNKIKKGESFIKILLYILSRSAALLIMGFFHVNLEDYSTAAMLPKAVWGIIITVSFFLIWLDYPETMNKTRKYVLTGTGILLLIAMAALYKGGSPEAPTWMKPSWWGILGIIGWSYLVCAVLFLLSKGRLNMLIIFWVIFAAINVAVHMEILPGGFWLIGDGSSVTLTMGGIVISGLYARLVGLGKTQRLWLIMAVLGITLIAAGLLLRPFAGGISKIHSTPAWVMICSGITILFFELAIYLIDVKGKKNWFKWIAPAGTSTLTCYLMPYFLVFFMQLFDLEYPAFLNDGAAGLIRSFAISFILIILVGLMEKRRIRLKI
jgi:heparan-alpha-glucosaminide N-acetyltransferase